MGEKFDTIYIYKPIEHKKPSNKTFSARPNYPMIYSAAQLPSSVKNFDFVLLVLLLGPEVTQSNSSDNLSLIHSDL